MDGAAGGKKGKKRGDNAADDARIGRKEVIFEEKERKFNNKRNNSFY